MSLIIETPRLQLKRLSIHDAESMYAYASNPEVTKYLTWPMHTSPEDARQVIPNLAKAIEKGSNDGFAIHLKNEGMVGTVGMRWKGADKGEIGYVLSQDHWGTGIVTEAATAFVDYLWKEHQRLQYVEARCYAGHEASAGVMKKLGMKYLGFLPDEVFMNIHPEKKFPVWHYGLSRNDA